MDIFSEVVLSNTGFQEEEQKGEQSRKVFSIILGILYYHCNRQVITDLILQSTFKQYNKKCIQNKNIGWQAFEV